MAVLAPRPPPSTGWQKFQFLPKKRSWEPLTAPPPPPEHDPLQCHPSTATLGAGGWGSCPPPPRVLQVPRLRPGTGGGWGAWGGYGP